MRTTISLDDGLAADIKRRASAQQMSVSAFIEALLREAMHRPTKQQTPPPFRLVTVGRGGVHRGVDLDRAARLIEEEDGAMPIEKTGR